MTEDRHWYIIDFTVGKVLGGALAWQRPRRRKQTRRSAATGHSEPTPARCEAPPVSGQRVLRSSRSRSGQVRNVARGRRGRQFGKSIGNGLRFLAAFVLPSASCFRTGRTIRFDPAEARTAWRPQADAGSNGICGRDSGSQSIIGNRGVGPANRGAIRLASTSAKYRAQVKPKKTAVMQCVLYSRPVGNADMVTRYEELRRQALTPKSWGGGTQGLALFLRQGMKGWMDAWSRCHIVEPAKALIDSRSAEEVVPRNLHAEVVTILAAMALSIGTETRV